MDTASMKQPPSATATTTYKFKIQEFPRAHPEDVSSGGGGSGGGASGTGKMYSNTQPPRRKAIQNYYEFQKKCLELSADYYQGIASLLRDTDVSLFVAPGNQGDPLRIINETGMVINAAPKNRRAPRQLWSDDEVSRLKAAYDRYTGDWEQIIKEFEPDRTRIQIFQKARQIGLRAVDSSRMTDIAKPSDAGHDDDDDEDDDEEGEQDDQDGEHEVDAEHELDAMEGVKDHMYQEAS